MRKKYSEKKEIASADVQSEVVVEVLEERAADSECTATVSLVSRAVYRTFFGVSYGVVFGSLFIKKLLIPKDGVIEKGLRDGALAAQEDFEEIDQEVMERLQPEAVPESTEEPVVLDEAEPIPA